MINTPLNGGGADEKVTIHRRADCLCPEAGWAGYVLAECLPQTGYLRCHVYTWRKKYSGISPPELKHMRQLEEENLRLKRLVADLSLDKAMLQDVLAKKSRRWHVCGNG